ncbi:UNVERIFIED_ORG: hypothetical protein J2X79_001945 [Arthrobacter globiformis]|nr:hypothetical protein [Arthrobacter globiformis]
MVQRQDAYGNPTTANDTTLMLSSGPTSIFATNSAGAKVTQVTIAAGSWVASFYYGDTKAGTPTVTVSSTGLGAVAQTETISAGAASQLSFVTQPSAVVMNKPFDPEIHVLVADMFGNPANAGSVTISTSLSTCKLTGITTQQTVSGGAIFTGLQPQGNAVNCRLVATSGTLTATSTAYSTPNHG